MKSTDKHFVLEPNEYLVTADSSNASDYGVLYKGRELRGVVGLIIDRRSEEAIKK